MGSAGGTRVSLGYDRTGAGEPLVLLHTLGTDRRMWDPVVDRLAAERDVIAVDLPGFGESAPLAGEHVAPEALADAVAAFVAGLGVERPHVAGNSLGGWIALELARAGRARSVTAIAPAGLWREPLVPKRSSARRVARALLPTMPLLLRSERGRRAALGGTMAHPERIPPPVALAFVRAYARAPGFEAVNAGMRAGRITALAEIGVPLTFAWCEHDRLVRRPRALPAGAREFLLGGCGHMPTWDDPARVAEVLLA